MFRFLSKKKILLIASPSVTSSSSARLCITTSQLLLVRNRTFLLQVLVSCIIKVTDLRTRYAIVQKHLSNYKTKFHHTLQFIPQTDEWRNELISSCINLHRVTVVEVDMLRSRVGTRRTGRDARNYVTPGLKRLASPTRLAVDRLKIYTANMNGRTFYIWSASTEY